MSGLKTRNRVGVRASSIEARVLELEKQLHESEMKGIAWQSMVEIAEREFN